MPQVRILSPRCDQKPVPSWYLNRPARGGFFWLRALVPKRCQNLPISSAVLARLPRQVLTGFSTFKKLGPSKVGTSDLPTLPVTACKVLGLKTKRRLGTPLRSRRACRSWVSGGDGIRPGKPHPTSQRREWHSPARRGQVLAGFAVLTTNGLRPSMGA